MPQLLVRCIAPHQSTCQISPHSGTCNPNQTGALIGRQNLACVSSQMGPRSSDSRDVMIGRHVYRLRRRAHPRERTACPGAASRGCAQAGSHWYGRWAWVRARVRAPGLGARTGMGDGCMHIRLLHPHASTSTPSCIRSHLNFTHISTRLLHLASTPQIVGLGGDAQHLVPHCSAVVVLLSEKLIVTPQCVVEVCAQCGLEVQCGC